MAQRNRSVRKRRTMRRRRTMGGGIAPTGYGGRKRRTMRGGWLGERDGL